MVVGKMKGRMDRCRWMAGWMGSWVAGKLSIEMEGWEDE